MHRSIPSALARNVTALAGTEGVAWLRGLPDLLRDLEREWQLEVHGPFGNGEYNYVAGAVYRDGTSCVVKIAPPGGDSDHFGEAKYLKVIDGKGAVRLLAHDPIRRAMVIERAVPGETLTRMFEHNEAAAVKPAIELLGRTSRAIPADLTHTILLDDWFDGLRRYGETDFPAAYAEKTLNIYGRLRDQPELTGYLHGDFHPDNIVSAKRAEFLLIDPKGIIGHLGYEIAVFLNNYHWWQDEAPDIRERLSAALMLFAEAFSIPDVDLRQWAYAQMVLSAWWTFDEMPELYDDEVAKADIWDV